MNILRTSLEIDSDLLNEAVSLSGIATKRGVIEKALKEFVENRKQKNLYDLFDSDEILIDDEYDYKSMRGGKITDDFS